MSFSFLIPLGIGTLAEYIRRRSLDDIALLSATVSLVSYFIGLIIAPWQVQLLLLVVVLVWTSRLATVLWYKRQPSAIAPLENQGSVEVEPTQVPAPATNTCLYRGVPYLRSLPLESADTASTSASTPEKRDPFIGRYRGAPIPASPTSNEPIILKK